MDNFLENLRRKNFPSFVGVSIFAIIVNPLWSIFDFYLEPGNWEQFFIFRMVTASLHLASLLFFSQKKYRCYSIEGIWILTVTIQVEIAMMFPFIETNLYPYALGFTLPFIIVTILTSMPVLYTLSAFFIAVTAFVTSIYIRTYPISFEEVVFLIFFISTSLGVGLFTSFLRYRIERKDYGMRQKLDQLKSNFFANITHEFRTPLTLILGPVQNLLDKYPGFADRQEYNLIKKNALRLQSLINQLLDLSRMEAGKLKLHTTSQDIVGLSKSIFSTFESLATRRNITLVFKSDMPSQNVYIDFDKYEKILTNLLFNAFKFSEDGSGISVALSKTENHLYIKVIDEGIGIDPDQLGHIFERFYQVEAGNTRSYEGSGIGLALVKELVELHSGQIDVQSSPGHGAVFTITFLLGRNHLKEEDIMQTAETGLAFVNDFNTEPAEIESLSEHNPELPHLLVVEDNFDMQKYLYSFLCNDYSVLFAEDGRAGLKIAMEQVPDLVVCDVMMPVMDGFELCKLLKNDIKTSHIPLVMLTAKVGTQDKLKGLESGADDYLFKPFSGKELKVRIKNLLGQRRQLQQKFAKNIFISPNKLDIGKTDKSLLDEVLSAIENNLDNPNFQVDDLASTVSLSRGQLHRKLKAFVNKSTTEFIRSYRLQRAAKFLSDNNHSVGEVAFKVGFNNLSYFTESFKKQYGVLPSKYSK